MKIFEYAGYSDYVAAQTEGNRRKMALTWVTPHNIDLVRGHRGPDARSVLCHGTRNGAEQRFFKACYPGAVVIGTEISDTAEQFEMTVRHDMQEPKPEWVGRFDIVFSNSFDHAIRPQDTLRVWLEQLSPNGRLYVDHANDPRVNRSDRTDPLEISDEELTAMIEGCSGVIEQRMPGFGPRKCRTLIYAVRRGA